MHLHAQGHRQVSRHDRQEALLFAQRFGRRAFHRLGLDAQMLQIVQFLPELTEGHIAQVGVEGGDGGRFVLERQRFFLQISRPRIHQIVVMQPIKLQDDLIACDAGDDFGPRSLDALLQFPLRVQFVDRYFLKMVPILLTDVNNVAGEVIHELLLNEEGTGAFQTETKKKVFVSDTALGRDLQIDHGRNTTQSGAQQQHRRDERDQADAAGANGGQLLVGAEPPEDEQRGGQHAHRQREHEHERNQEAQRLRDQPNRRLAIDQQREDLLQQVSEQEHEREHCNSHRQCGQHLSGQVKMERFHAALRQ